MESQFFPNLHFCTSLHHCLNYFLLGVLDSMWLSYFLSIFQADPLAVDNFGGSCLHYACRAKKPSPNLIRLLLRGTKRTQTLAKQQAKAMQHHHSTGDQRRGSSSNAVVAWNAHASGDNGDENESEASSGPSAPPSHLSGGCNPLLEERLAGFTVR